MCRAETPIYTMVLSRRCREALKTSEENLLMHRMSKVKMVKQFWEKKKFYADGEYISVLFEDHRKDYNVIKHNFLGPLNMKNEIQVEIRKIKSGQATGPDSISVELLENRWKKSTSDQNHVLGTYTKQCELLKESAHLKK